jgi:hypothetical protein
MNNEEYARLPVASLTALLPINRETGRRWRRRRRIPPVPYIALKLRHEGDLGLISPRWAGWMLRQDELLSPEGVSWNPGRLNAWAYERQELASRRRRAELPEQHRLQYSTTQGDQP